MATKDEIEFIRKQLVDADERFGPSKGPDATFWRRSSAALMEYIDDAELRIASLEGAAEALLKADARIRELEAKAAASDSCEVCGDCLLPELARCERHTHTERGDYEWPVVDVDD
jgi:hypothetical protein